MLFIIIIAQFMSSSKGLCIVSSNTRGLRDANKRGDMWLYYKQLNADIICLQETHLTESDQKTLALEWNIEYHLGGVSTNSRGVAILIKNSFEYKILNSFKDNEGRILILELEIANLTSILLVNIYGPNKDSPLWYDKLFDKIDEYNLDHVIIVGDWNVALQNKDTYNYAFQRNLGSRTKINNYIGKNNFVDIWREQNKENKRFTWGCKKPFKDPDWIIS